MARKMRKFSAGGAQGKYDRRMADIEKDRKIALAKGKNADVVEAKAAQRKADAEDDRAKRTGADRTATRKAEYDAEQRLSRTRKFGADKPAAAAEPAKASTPEPAKASTPEPAKAKPQSFGAAFKEARSRLGAGKTFTYNGKSFTTNIAGEGRKRTSGGSSTNNSASASSLSTNNSAAKPKDRYYVSPENRKAIDAAAKKTPFSVFDKTAFDKLKSAGAPPPPPPPPADPKQVAYEKYINDRDKELGKSLAALSPFGSKKDRAAAYDAKLKAAGKLAKGGKVKKEKTMKYAKGGSTPPQPTAAERKSDAKFRESVKKVKVTPENAAAIGRGNRSESDPANIVKKYSGDKQKIADAVRTGQIGMKKGGKMASCGMKKGGKAATKFGAAMKKKSADTKGRAMMKKAGGGKCYASGGLVSGHKSADGIAKKGKTKGKMATMARGGKTC